MAVHFDFAAASWARTAAHFSEVRCCACDSLFCSEVGALGGALFGSEVGAHCGALLDSEAAALGGALFDGAIGV